MSDVREKVEDLIDFLSSEDGSRALNLARGTMPYHLIGECTQDERDLALLLVRLRVLIKEPRSR